ncbi:hypothetical protein [Amycolatopsis sp. lyj-109]|uniref:hypothetical protein n=1 Tax=Amycolatopsis sp. lyj-109 TaxID=2789287 RepID=UPI00397D1B25
MEDDLFLRLVVAPQRPDDLGHPGAVVAAFLDERPVVHDLHARGFVLPAHAGVGDLRDDVGSHARGGGRHPAGRRRIEPRDIGNQSLRSTSKTGRR